MTDRERETPGAVTHARLAARLRASAAWAIVPAIAMSVSLGVTLPSSPASAAPTTINPTTSGVILSNYYPDTVFDVPTGTVSKNGGSAPHAAIYGEGAARYTLTNEGTINGLGGDNGVQFKYTGGYINNSNTIGGADGIVIGSVSGHATVVNSGTITGTVSAVYINGSYGGTVTNNGGTITGASYGIKISGGAGTLINNGTITGTNSMGAYLALGGSVYNKGTIAGYSAGVAIKGAAGTVVNLGTIKGIQVIYDGTGVLLTNGGTVTNGSASATGAQINGVYAGVLVDGHATVTNFGTITAAGTTILLSPPFGPVGAGVAVGGGTVINGTALDTTALISGFDSGVTLVGAGIVTNYGTIKSNQVGVIFGGGGTLVNGSATDTGALISGGYFGVQVQGAGTITNFATITASGGSGVSMGSGTLVNGSSTDLAALISGTSYGVKTSGAGMVTNFGTITSPEVGVGFIGGGSLYNAGSIYGQFASIRSYNDSVTVTNSGTLVGYFAGVALHAGGTITNSGTVLNTGNSAYNGAIAISGGGTVINSTVGAQILGYGFGVKITGAAGTVINYGTIKATYNTAVSATGVILTAGGAVINKSTGYIYGFGTGVYAGYGSVTNQGAIVGSVVPGITGDGVRLSTGGALNNNGGTVTGYSGVYATGAATILNSGTIIGSGSGFGAAGVYLISGGSIDNSAGTITGVLYGAHLKSGGTVVNSATISGTGAGSVGIELNAGGTVTNNSGGHIVGALLGVYAGSAATILNSGSIVTSTLGTDGVQLHNGGTVNNYNGGYIYGHSAGVRGDAGGLILNAGSIISANAAVYLLQGGSVSNSAGGLISGPVYGVDVVAGAGIIVNAGTIQNTGAGASSSGILLGGGGTVTNTGTITGHDAGVRLTAGGTIFNGDAGHTGAQIKGDTGILAATDPVYVTNYGTITGANISPSFTDGISLLAGGTVTNSGTIIGQYGHGVYMDGAGVVVNKAGGLISGQTYGHAYGVYLKVGGSITNAGTILGVFNGVAGGNTTGILTVVNSGTIKGTGGSGIGIYQHSPGGGLVVTNSATGYVFGNDAGLSEDGSGALTLTNLGTIAGGGTGANSGTGTGTIFNAGLITGGLGLNIGGHTTATNTGTITGTTGDGVVITNGTLTNKGLIQGATFGLVANTGATVFNTGTIKDPGTAGADLTSGASVYNQPGGLITGTIGADFTGTGATLTNDGTITGTGGTAIQLDATANTVNLGTGSVLNGNINGGGGPGQILLMGTGTLNTPLVNFGAGSGLIVTNGANWNVNGAITIATLTNNGTLQPGVPGTPLVLTGNFVQSASGVFETVLNASGGASELEASGSATLAGGVVDVPPPTFIGTQRYTILTAAAGVSGTFSSVSGGGGFLSMPVLSYDAHDVFLTLTQLPLTTVAMTPNQVAAAAALDNAFIASPPTFGPVFASFDQFTNAGQVNAALDQVDGENNADLSTLAILAGRQFINQFQDHTVAGHFGSLPDGAHPAQFEQGWAIWGSGFGQSGFADGDGNSHRMDENIMGFSMGAEYGVLPTLKLGAMFGYAHGRLDVAGGTGGFGRGDFTAFAGTGDYVDGPLYLTGIVGDVEGRGTTARPITLLPGLSGTAGGKPSDSEVFGAFEAGYGVSGLPINLTPFAGLNFGSVDQGAFAESGAGLLNLVSLARTTSSVQSQLGGRVNMDLPVGDAIVTSDFKLAWGHEFSDTGRFITEYFASGASTNTFTIAGAPMPSDSAVIGVGFTTAIAPGGVIYLRYDGDIASHAESNAITAGLRFAW